MRKESALVLLGWIVILGLVSFFIITSWEVASEPPITGGGPNSLPPASLLKTIYLTFLLNLTPSFLLKIALVWGVATALYIYYHRYDEGHERVEHEKYGTGSDARHVAS